MYVKIKSFEATINPSTKGAQIRLHLVNDQVVNLTGIGADVYSALLLSLKDDTAQWDVQNNCIGVGPELAKG